MSREQLILAQAAEWYALLRDEKAGEADRQGWRAWLAADPEHARAWQRVESVIAPFQRAGGAAALAAGTLAKAPGAGRRRAVRVLGFGGLAIGIGLLLREGLRRNDGALQTASPADWRTGVGEQRRLTLADGTTVAINTASAVEVDVGRSLRRIVLHAGEILVTSARDTLTPARPLVVDTRHGRITALGTRFDVRDAARDVQVAVFAGAVRVAPAGAGTRPVEVAAGRLVRFTADRVNMADRIDPWRESWSRGLLVADDALLGEFVAELARYTSRPIRIDEAAARLRLVGVYPINAPARDVPAILAALGHALPVGVEPASGGWAIRAR
jgi:transmembrane sensor